MALIALGHLTSALAGLPEVVAAVKPSVVAVGTFDPTASPRFGFRGTGFAAGDGNMVLTNRHVLPGVEDIGSNSRLAVAIPRAAQMPEVRRAKVVASDSNHDLAVLRIEGAPLPPLAMPSGDLPPEGRAIALIGFPLGAVLGLSPVTHRGIIASVTPIALPAPTSRQLDERTIARLRMGSFKILQLDAVAYPGNSGSPVVDAETGELIGIVNLVLIKGTRESAISSPTGITYAVPIVHARDLLGSTGR